MRKEIVSINRLSNNKGQINGLPKNPRFCKDHKFVQLKQSIKEDPEMLELREVIAVDYNGELVVIAGNMRLNACLELGIKEVPCKILPQDTPIDKLKAITIKDNVGFGEHDWDALANDWDVEELAHWGLDLPLDFEDDALEVDAVEDDYEMPEQIETDIVLGDLFEIGEHRLLCGDSTDSDAVARLMDGQKIGIIVTDPPYGIGIDGQKESKSKNPKHNRKHHENLGWDSERPATELFGYLLSQDVPTLIWGGNYFADLLPASRGWLYWSKGQSGLTMSDGELAWTNKDKVLREFTVNRGQLHGSVHPTQKPVKVISESIKYLESGGIIFDCFMGSGTTMVAANEINRICYGIEMQPKYCQVIIDRMRKLDPTIKITKNGQPYESVQAPE